MPWGRPETQKLDMGMGTFRFLPPLQLQVERMDPRGRPEVRANPSSVGSALKRKESSPQRAREVQLRTRARG